MRGMPFVVAACVLGLIFGTGALAADQSAGSSGSSGQYGASDQQTGQSESTGQSGTHDTSGAKDSSGMTTGGMRDRMSHRGEFRLILGANLIGTTVRNEKNEDLGKLTELAVNPDRGRVAYGVLEGGGTLGMGDKYFAIPFVAFNVQHKEAEKGKVDHLVLNIEKDRLKNAKGFDKNNWPDMANVQWAKEIHVYFGQEPYWQEDEGTLRGEPVSPEGRDQGTSGQREPGTGETRSDAGGTAGGTTGEMSARMSGTATHRILKAEADIRGRTVRDNAGTDIGKVSDLLIGEHTGRVPFVLVKLNDASKYGDKNNDFAAIPFKAFNWTDAKSGGKELTFTMAADKIKGQTFSNNNWPDLSSREWATSVYRHYGVAPMLFDRGAGRGMMGGSERGGSKTQ